jgi:hypothetical protein
VTADPGIDRDIVERIVAAAKPAHVPHVIVYGQPSPPLRR